MAVVKARLFTSDAMAERTGVDREIILEAEWFQLTYNVLRSAPDGETLAGYDAALDAWHLIGSNEDKTLFSDIVIFEPNEYEQEV